MISLVDCHAHLHDSEFDRDRTEVLARASLAGVGSIVTAGTDISTSAAAVALAEYEPTVWAAVGIHPHEASAAMSDDIERLESLAASERVVAIGEIGLDYHYDHAPREAQRHRFEEQLELAGELDLPVVIHSRDANSDTLAILSSWAARQRAVAAETPLGVMHCYSYGPRCVAEYASLGLMLSIPGIVTYPKATEVQAAAIAIDLDNLLVESDCPYLAPQSRRGRRNEPSLVAETAAGVAALRGVSIKELSVRTTANAHRLFRLPALSPTMHVAGDRPAQEPA